MAALASAQPERRRTQLPRFGLIFAAWLVPALLSAFDNYMQSRLNNERPDWRWVLFNGVDWLLYAVLTPAVFRISRRFPLQREGLVVRTVHAQGVSRQVRHQTLSHAQLLPGLRSHPCRCNWPPKVYNASWRCRLPPSDADPAASGWIPQKRAEAGAPKAATKKAAPRKAAKVPAKL